VASAEGRSVSRPLLLLLPPSPPVLLRLLLLYSQFGD